MVAEYADGCRVDQVAPTAVVIEPGHDAWVEGDAPAHDALLVLGSAPTPDAAQRPDLCCGVEFWLDSDTVVYESQTQPRQLVSWRVGTHDLGRVASIVGFDPDRELLVSSYARIWDR